MHCYMPQPEYYFPREYFPLIRERVDPGSPKYISIREELLASVLQIRDVISWKEIVNIMCVAEGECKISEKESLERVGVKELVEQISVKKTMTLTSILESRECVSDKIIKCS